MDDKGPTPSNAKNIAAQFVRFAIVGIIAFLIDYSLLIILTEVFNIMYLVSSIISYTIATIFNYLASMRFVFAHRENMTRRREFIIVFVLSIIALGLNTLLLWLGVSILGWDYRIAKLIVTLLVTTFNFVTRRVFLDATREAEKEAKKAIKAAKNNPE